MFIVASDYETSLSACRGSNRCKPISFLTGAGFYKHSAPNGAERVWLEKLRPTIAAGSAPIAASRSRARQRDAFGKAVRRQHSRFVPSSTRAPLQATFLQSFPLRPNRKPELADIRKRENARPQFDHR